MEHEKLKKIINKYLKAYNQFDIATMLDCLSDDCKFYAVAGGQIIKTCNNKDEFRQTAEHTAELFSHREMKAVNFILDATKAAVEIQYQGIIKRDLANGLKAGQEINLTGVSIFMFKKDLISKLCEYT